MPILIVGTSNSMVRGGWYDAFTESQADSVKRISLGGAPFTQFLSRLSDIQEIQPDHIILECSANDESYPQFIGNDMFFDKLFHIFLSSLRSIAPVTVLRIPPLATLSKLSHVARRQKVICEQLGCTFYDAAPDIIQLAGNRSPYRDKHHPVTDIAHAFGKQFSEVFLNIEASPPIAPDKLLNYTSAIGDINLPSLGCATNEIKTSLLHETFVVLEPNKSIKLPKNIFALGFFINSGETSGILRISGPIERRELFCFYMDPSNKNVKRFIPLTNGMQVREVSCIWAHKAIDFALHTDLFHFPQKVSLGKILYIDSEKMV